MSLMNRRHILRLAGLAGTLVFTSAVQAREPILRSGPPRFHFGLAAYSLRNYFAYNKGKAKEPATDGAQIDMFGFVDYCAKYGFDSTELR